MGTRGASQRTHGASWGRAAHPGDARRILGTHPGDTRRILGTRGASKRTRGASWGRAAHSRGHPGDASRGHPAHPRGSPGAGKKITRQGTTRESWGHAEHPGRAPSRILGGGRGTSTEQGRKRDRWIPRGRWRRIVTQQDATRRILGTPGASRGREEHPAGDKRTHQALFER
jgi:hypothetical protein